MAEDEEIDRVISDMNALEARLNKRIDTLELELAVTRLVAGALFHRLLNALDIDDRDSELRDEIGPATQDFQERGGKMISDFEGLDDGIRKTLSQWLGWSSEEIGELP